MAWLKNNIQKIMNFKKSMIVGLDILETSFPQYLILKKSGKELTLFDCGRIFDCNEAFLPIQKNAKSIAVAIPRDKLILRIFHINYTQTQSLMEKVLDKAQHSIPFKLSDVLWRDCVIHKQRGKATVLFVAVERRLVAKYQRDLAKIGFKEVLLTASTLAYFNSFLYNYIDKLEDQHYLLLDLGMRQLEICVVSNGGLVFTRSLNLGAEYVIRLIAEAMDLDFGTAQSILFAQKNIKDLGRDDMDEKLREVFHLWTTRFIKEVEMASRFFVTKYNKNITKLVLSGCSFDLNYNLEYFLEILKTHFEKDVEILDPLSKVVLDEHASFNMERVKGNALSIPMGLALHFTKHIHYDISFTSKAQRRRDQFENQYFRPFAALLIVLFLLGFLLNTSSVNKKESQLRELRTSVNMERKKAKGIQKKSAKIKKTLGEMKIPLSSFIRLKNVLKVLPSDMSLTQISVERERMVLKGIVAEKRDMSVYTSFQRKIFGEEALEFIDDNHQDRHFVLVIDEDLL